MTGPLPAAALAAAAGGAGVLVLGLLVAASPGTRPATRRTVLLASLFASLLAPIAAVAGSLLGLGLLPGPAPLPPAAASPLPETALGAGGPPAGPAVTVAQVPAPEADPAATSSPERRADPARILLYVWGAGSALALLRLGAGLFRVRRIAAALRPCKDPRVLAAARSAAAGLGLSGLEIRESLAVGTPAVLGVGRPLVVLPPGIAGGLADDELAGVLVHEAAHAAARDPAAGLLARAAVALRWWDPLVHLAARRLAAAGEAAADGAVLFVGAASPARYAGCLVRMADRARLAPDLLVALPAPGISRGALEGRVRDLLLPGAGGDPRGTTRGRLLAAAVLLAGAGCAATAVPAPAPQVSGEEHPTPDAPGLVFEGRVLDPGGRPLAGATVIAQNGPCPQSIVSWNLPPWRSFVPDPLVTADTGPIPVRGRAVTGDDGRFRVEGIPPPLEGFVRVVHPSFPAVLVPPGADPPRDGIVGFGDVRLEPGAAMEALVHDAAGEPVARAWVAVHPAVPADPGSVFPPAAWPAPGDVRVARTGEDGRCRVEGLRPGPWTAAAFADGSRIAARAVDGTGGGEASAAFTLEAGRSIRVLVLDRRSGIPVPGARVDLSVRPVPDAAGRVVVSIPGPPPLATLRTGTDGAAVFEGLDDGPFEAIATPPDYAGDRVHHPPPFSVSANIAAEEVVRLLLDPPAALLVEAADGGTGAPVAGLRLKALPVRGEYDAAGGFPHEVAAGSAEAAGAVLLEGLRPGTWSIRAFAPDHLPVVAGPVRIAAGGAPPPLRIPLVRAGASLSGRVVDSSGAPVPGARVSSYEWVEWLGDGQRRSAATDAEGGFELRLLLGPGFPLRVEIAAEGYLPALVEQRGERPGTLPDAVLRRAGRVEGRLLDAAGAPVPHAPLALVLRGRDPGLKSSHMAGSRTDAGGRFAFRGLEPGAYTVLDRGGARADVDVREGEAAAADLRRSR